MHPPGFADRHAVLDPEQRLVRRQLGQQETRPAPIAGRDGEYLGKGWLRGRQPEWRAQLLGEKAFIGRADSSAGDQGKFCSHTTRNAFVLLLFYFPRLCGKSQGCDSEGVESAMTRDADTGAAGAIGLSSGGLPSTSVRKVRISATTRLSAGR